MYSGNAETIETTETVGEPAREYYFSVFDANNYDISIILEEAMMDAGGERIKNAWGPYILHLEAMEQRGENKLYHFKALYKPA